MKSNLIHLKPNQFGNPILVISRTIGARKLGSFAFIIILASLPDVAIAQILPKGIIAVSAGYRNYYDSENFFNERNAKKSLGSKFDTDFSGPQMAAGQVGEEFKKLYDTVKSLTDQSVADQMDFGRLRGTVDVNVKASFLGIGYGVTDRFFLFAGVPVVDSSLTTNLVFEEGNAAINGNSEFQSSLYTSLYKKLKDNVRLNLTKVKSTIENDLSYAPIDRWHHHGLGDIVLGTKYRALKSSDKAFSVNFDHTFKALLPTGHSDDPDNLIDMPIGRGYYQLSPGFQASFTWHYLALELESSYGIGVPITTKRRLPENEEKLIPAERKYTVKMDPGDEINLKYGLGTNFTVINGHISRNYAHSFRDKFSGSQPGNYEALAADSDRSLVTDELGLSISSLKTYRRSLISIPAIISLTSTRTVSGRNSPALNWYELSLTTFLDSKI